MTKATSAQGHAISPVLPVSEPAGGGGERPEGGEVRAENGEEVVADDASGQAPEHLGQDDDVQPHRPLKSPIPPSAAMRAEHDATHLPYRCWCDGCVEGFGRERGHPSSGSLAGRKIPAISYDYPFVS